jgi:hypothetical protein
MELDIIEQLSVDRGLAYIHQILHGFCDGTKMRAVQATVEPGPLIPALCDGWKSTGRIF